MNIAIKRETFELKKIFTISRGSKVNAEVITISISKNGFIGYGECIPYKRYNETIDSVINQIETVKKIDNRDEINTFLPAGAARNAIDCAMWDLEAKILNSSVFEISNLPKPKPVTSAFTLSLSSPSEMAKEARINASKSILKIKLGGGIKDIERIEAIKKSAPHSKIIVDANESWSVDDFLKIEPIFYKLGVKMIEQPFQSKEDDHLINIKKNIPICADESCHTSSDLANCINKYDIVNIKLDKTGGLTEAIKLKKQALKLKFEVMIGCMVGTSLSIAPALLLTDDAKWIDLDGPLLLKNDREYPLVYKNDNIFPASKKLWG